MRCTQCRGQIERPGAICPHCGVALSGIQKLRSQVESSGPTAETPFVKQRPGAGGQQVNPGQQIAELVKRLRDLALRDTKSTIISGMIAGAIFGKLMGFGWIIGSIFGGFVTFKYLETK